MSTSPPSQSEILARAKAQIRGLVDEIERLSRSDLPPERFYPEFLHRLVSAVAGLGGAIWLKEPEGGLRLACQLNMDPELLNTEIPDAQRHVRLVRGVLQGGGGRYMPPKSGTEQEGNPTQTILLLAALGTQHEVEGVVEVFQRPTVGPEVCRGNLQFLHEMSARASHWFKSRRLQNYSDRETLWQQVNQFARQVHDNLDARQTAFSIANEARMLITCDRVSVGLVRGRRTRVTAVSGQDVVDQRSNLVAGMRRLCDRVVATGEPLWFFGDKADLPPQLEKALDNYIDESFAKGIGVVPLRRPTEATAADGRLAQGEIIGVMVVEQIESDLSPEALRQRTELVYDHSAQALANSLDFSNLFLMPVWRLLGKATDLVRGRALPKTLAVTALLTALVAAMVLVPLDFRLEAPGRLQPIVRRDVFAQADGIVHAVNVKHGSEVKAGDVLVELRNTDLEVQFQDVQGQKLETIKQLDALRRALLRDRKVDPEERNQISGQIGQLEKRLENLNVQEELLKHKQERLQVVSPIDGRIITWDADNLLRHRPVQTGEVLLSVVDPTKGWELELFMPERRMGHIARQLSLLGREASDSAGIEPARGGEPMAGANTVALEAAPNEENGEGGEQEEADGPVSTSAPRLEVSFILASEPELERHGRVREIHMSANLHEEEGHSVRIVVDLDENDPPLNEPRPGAKVIGDVHCGRRPMGYVLFHEAWEAFQRFLF